MEFYLIGYSGHAYVTIESALDAGCKIIGYFENEEKKLNPYSLSYLGSEDLIVSDSDFVNKFFFVGVGNNKVRSDIFAKLDQHNFINLIDPSANISNTSKLEQGIYIGKNACVNALSCIGKGSIINTRAIVEHECELSEFVHLAPGAVLCGNVKVGANTFIGANSVVRQGIQIGNDVVIGAGSVVVKNVPDGSTIYGNPARKIN